MTMTRTRAQNPAYCGLCSSLSQIHLFEHLKRQRDSFLNSFQNSSKQKYILMRKKYTVADMQKLAEKRGGKFLSPTYEGMRHRHLWQCSAGHQWEATPDNIKRRSWCPDCAGNQPNTIEEMHEIAEARSGRCLSDEYVNARTKLLWQCSAGHPPWEANPDKIKAGTWCPKCGDISNAQKRKGTIEEMQSIAEERGGKCLSSEYFDNRTKLKWECAEGHQWEAKPANIKQGQWCPKCGRDQTNKAMDARKLTLEEMQAIAEAKGGKCLSSEYVNNRTKLKFECAEGHQWEVTPANVKQGRWCPVCVGKLK